MEKMLNSAMGATSAFALIVPLLAVPSVRRCFSVKDAVPTVNSVTSVQKQAVLFVALIIEKWMRMMTKRRRTMMRIMMARRRSLSLILLICDCLPFQPIEVSKVFL